MHTNRRIGQDPEDMTEGWDKSSLYLYKKDRMCKVCLSQEGIWQLSPGINKTKVLEPHDA